MFSTPRFLVAVSIFFLFLASAAIAQDPQRVDGISSSAKGLIVTLGSGGQMGPAFEGSKTQIVRPMLVVGLRNKGDPASFSMPGDSPSLALHPWQPNGGLYSVGLLARYAPGRGASVGVASVPNGAEIGAFVDLWPYKWLRFRGEMQQAAFGQRGLTTTLSATAVWSFPSLAAVTLDPALASGFSSGPSITSLDGFKIGIGPRIKFGDDMSNRPFDVSSAQALAARDLRVYRVGSGVKSVGMEGAVYVPLSQTWMLRGTLAYDRIVGRLAGSPVVSARGSVDQFYAGLSLSYDLHVPSPF
jgi:MipA family protein